MRLRAREKTTSGFHIPSSGHLRSLLGRKILELALLVLRFYSRGSSEPGAESGREKSQVIFSRALGWFYRFSLAFLAALFINGAGLLLVIQLNKYVKIPLSRAKAAPETIHLQEPPKKKPEHRVRPRRTQMRPKALPLPLPSLPSKVSSETLMPNVSEIDLLSDVIGQERGFGTDLIFEEEQVDEPPKVIRRVAPEYPFAAENRGIEGFVILKLQVASSGRVESVWVTDSAPVGVFENAAQKAARQYRFSPARFKGRAVAVYCRQKIVFKLQE